MNSGRVSANAGGANWFARLAAVVLIGAAALALSTHSGEANSKYAAIVVDGSTGETLFARYADEERYPASVTKIMTLYLLFEELRAGRMTLDTPIPVSAFAAKQVPSKIGFKPGQTIRTRDAIRALVTKSANDVAVAIAEKIGGTEAKFAERMTSTARRLGMRSTVFRNASGLPNRAQHTTARDLARLGLAVQRDFPVYYSYFNTRSFTYRGQSYRNHNRLLGKVDGVDGIKTGFINDSGFNLVASVKRDGRFIVAVVMGGRTGRTRDQHMTDLIETYIPKAKQGTAGMAVIAAEDIPVPSSRPEMPVFVAEAPDTPQRLTPELIAAYAASVNAAEVANDPIEQVAAIGSADSVDLAEDATASVVDTAAAPEPTAAAPSGWHVQIAAAESESNARSLLLDAQRKNGAILGSRQIYTERVDVNGTTLYRARFTGFASKSEAWEACSELKKRKVSCWALNPSS
ncbi:D-alanyl-D-alanine carboxypeptidase [Amorphus sp. MBR-141]